MVIASIKSGPVFAESQVSLSITPELIDLRLMSEGFTEESQTITASTSSLTGYTIGIKTNGQTSALVNTQ
ncbi:hypothetical protein J6X90_02730, partial [Candidatus Saccharibacteria bacterium]|nr:hypothetical protein [Candidatus Saccharibacteria bacterium]